MGGYTNNSGFPLTAQHQLDYNKWLAAEAHARGLSIGLKNNLLQVEELEPYFDFALNESCLQYNECYLLTPFVDGGARILSLSVELRQRQGRLRENRFDSPASTWHSSALKHPISRVCLCR